jgi:Peptidase A4 family
MRFAVPGQAFGPLGSYRPDPLAVNRKRSGPLGFILAVAVLVAIGMALLAIAGVFDRPHTEALSLLAPATQRPSPTPAAAPASPAPTPSASPAVSLVPVGQPIVVAGLETHTVLRVEDWLGPTPATVGERYLAVEVQVQSLPGKTARYDQLYYTVENANGVSRNAPEIGRQPALTYGILGPGERVSGWISFLVPNPGPFVLDYHYPLGTNGQTADEKVALDPILPPSPDPVVPPPADPGTTSSTNFGLPKALSSTNYSGYGAELPGSSVSSVSGSWTQSTVHCSGKETSAVATWVGIDDGGVRNLEQVGTEAVCQPGSKVPTYATWYEMYPQPQVPVASIRPGDHFTASVSKRGSAWTLTIKDTTTGRSFTTKKTRTATALEALWVIEAPARAKSNGDLQVLPLSSFGKMTMTGCSAVVGGARRVISDARVAHYRFDMRTQSGAAKAVTSALVGSGTSFSSTWKHR